MRSRHLELGVGLVKVRRLDILPSIRDAALHGAKDGDAVDDLVDRTASFAVDRLLVPRKVVPAGGADE